MKRFVRIHVIFTFLVAASMAAGVFAADIVTYLSQGQPVFYLRD